MRSLRNIVVFSVLIAIFVFFLVCLFFASFDLSSIDKNENLKKYQKNIFEEDSNTKFHKFGEVPYECTGSCYCKEKDQHQKTSSMILRNSKYFFVAATSAIAYKLAKSHFSDECRSGEFSSQCQQSEIFSEVEECKRIDEAMKNEESMEEFFMTFNCYGKCVQNPDSDRVLGKIAREFDCKKLKTEGKVLVKESEIPEGNEYLGDTERFMNAAKDRFIATYLDPHCKKNSQHEFYEKFATMDKRKLKNQEGIGKKRVTRPLCAGTTLRRNPTVICVPLHQNF